MKIKRSNLLPLIIALFSGWGLLTGGWATTLEAVENGKSQEAAWGQTAKSILSSVKLGGYVQSKYIADQDSSADPNNQFKIFRARFKITGKVHEKASYKLMFGAYEPPPSKEAKPSLVDGFVDLAFHPLANLKLGQYFIPFGLEAPSPIPKHLAIERSQVTSRQNNYAIFRDVGVQLHGKYDLFSYNFAVLNGVGAAVTNKDGTLRGENNDKKDFVGTIRYAPCQMFTVGVSAHRGWFGAHQRDRVRWAGFFKGKIENLSYMAEYITKIDERKDESDQRSQGGYLLLAYRFMEQFEPMVRGEILDPDTGKSGDRLSILTLGMNYYFWKTMRAAANYEFRDDQAKNGGEDLFQALLQFAF